MAENETTKNAKVDKVEVEELIDDSWKISVIDNPKEVEEFVLQNN